MTVRIDPIPVRVRPSTVSFPPTPIDDLFEVLETSRLSEEDWRALSNVPGAFYRETEDPYDTLPAGSPSAFEVRGATQAWPEPIFVPRSSARPLANLTGPLPKLPTREIPPIRVPQGFGFTPSPFQIEAVTEILTLGRHLTLLPPGVGKTAIGVIAAHSLLKARMIDAVVAIVPAGLSKVMWEPVLESLGEDVSTVEIGGDRTRRRRFYRNAERKGWFTVGFDTLRLDAHARIADPLFGPRTFALIDEVQNLKNVSTKRWREIRKLLNRTETDYRLSLSGTVLHDTPVDSFGPIDLLGLRTWASYDEFLRRYFKMTRIRTGHRDHLGREVFIESPDGLVGQAEADELGAIIREVAYYRTRDQIGLQLPPLVEETLYATPDAAEEMLYRDAIRGPILNDLDVMEKQFPTAYEPNPSGPEHRFFDGVATSMLSDNLLGMFSMERLFSTEPSLILTSESRTAERMRDAVGTVRFRGIPIGAKLRTLIRFLGDYLAEDATSKVVVFCTSEKFFRRLEEIGDTPLPSGILTEDEQDAVARIHAASVSYTGELDPSQRKAVLSRFLDDPKIRVFLSTDVGGQGLDGLQGVANAVVHYDDPLSLGTYEQRTDRVWRRGTKDRVLSLRIETLYSDELSTEIAKRELPPAMDRRVREILDYKRRQVEMVTRRKAAKPGDAIFLEDVLRLAPLPPAIQTPLDEV